MIHSLVSLILLTTIAACTESKGSCPALPPLMLKKSLVKPSPSYRPDADAQFAGTVWLEIAINAKGYVCTVLLLRGFDKVADERAVSSARGWHLHPFRGQPVAVRMQVDVNFLRKPNGELIQVPESENASAPSTLPPWQTK